MAGLDRLMEGASKGKEPVDSCDEKSLIVFFRFAFVVDVTTPASNHQTLFLPSPAALSGEQVPAPPPLNALNKQ